MNLARSCPGTMLLPSTTRTFFGMHLVPATANTSTATTKYHSTIAGHTRGNPSNQLDRRHSHSIEGKHTRLQLRPTQLHSTYTYPNRTTIASRKSPLPFVIRTAARANACPLHTHVPNRNKSQHKNIVPYDDKNAAEAQNSPTTSTKANYHSKRAHSPDERVCHDLISKSAQQEKRELATYKFNSSHLHFRVIALGDSFAHSHPPIESDTKLPSLAVPSMSTITSKAGNISRS